MQNQLRPGPTAAAPRRIVPVPAVATTKRVGLRRGGPPEANGALIRSHFFTRSEITAFPAWPGRPGRFLGRQQRWSSAICAYPRGPDCRDGPTAGPERRSRQDLDNIAIMREINYRA